MSCWSVLPARCSSNKPPSCPRLELWFICKKISPRIRGKTDKIISFLSRPSHHYEISYLNFPLLIAFPANHNNNYSLMEDKVWRSLWKTLKTTHLQIVKLRNGLVGEENPCHLAAQLLNKGEGRKTTWQPSSLTRDKVGQKPGSFGLLWSKAPQQGRR